MTTMTSTCIPVTLTDEQGYPMGKEVSVFLDYAVSVERGWWGKDADEQRGVKHVEYDVLDTYIEARDLTVLTAEQAAWAIEEATDMFHSRLTTSSLLTSPKRKGIPTT